VDGQSLVNGLTMDAAGNLYGATWSSASGFGGTIFELGRSGGGWTEEVLYNFSFSGSPYGLAMDAAGNIFAVANQNTLTEVSPNGNGGWNGTVIHNFSGGAKDGSNPTGTPVLDASGNIYGTTTGGGAKSNGTVYKLTPVTTGKKKGTWTEKILYSFMGGTKDGSDRFGGIVFDAAGNIYGSTNQGGKYVNGTVYKLVASDGRYKEKILWNFNGTDGSGPYDSLILDGGNLYGTTYGGGASGAGFVFEVNPGAAATTTTLMSSPNPSTSGEEVTFTAVVTPAPPNGELVSFMDGATLLGTGTLTGGSAAFATSARPVGMSQITAVYDGDSNFGGSTSKALKQTVKK